MMPTFNTDKLQITNYKLQKKTGTTFRLYLSCDPCRIQTCNPHIRSVVLYSVELMDPLFSKAGAKVLLFFDMCKFFGKKNEKNCIYARKIVPLHTKRARMECVVYIALIYLAVINIMTFFLYGIDKWKAKRTKWRIEEATLLWWAAFGGSIGALLGMRIWHHKTLHKKFRYGVPAILIAQLIIVGVIIYYV